MKKCFILFISSLIILLNSCQPPNEKNKQEVEDDSELHIFLDTYFQSIPNFSGNVLLAQRGKVLFNKSYGDADKAFKALNNSHTKFNIGSITKPFTAMAVLKLVEEGDLNLEDSVVNFIPEAPSHWHDLTVHQLLSHTSGLIHTWDLLEDSTLIFQKSDLRNTLSWYYNEPLLFEPGTSFSYSGVGYLILAAIIETASQKEYNQYLKEEIFDPLNMENTGPSNPDSIIYNLAKGYIIDSAGTRNAPHFYLPLLTGGGHLYSTTEDLLKWDQALTDFSILSENMTEKMFSPVEENYGYGWEIIENDTLSMMFHTGFIPGFLSRIDRYPAHGLTLIILTNYQAEWSPVDSWEITEAIFQELGIK